MWCINCQIQLSTSRLLPLPLQFDLFDMKSLDLNLVMRSLQASKYQDFKVEGLPFHLMKWLKKMDIQTSNTCYFEAVKDIIFNFS